MGRSHEDVVTTIDDDELERIRSWAGFSPSVKLIAPSKNRQFEPAFQPSQELIDKFLALTFEKRFFDKVVPATTPVMAFCFQPSNVRCRADWQSNCQEENRNHRS
ncbi:hypothetical protein BVRB_004430 [Beta vulgaris subsp. vulgaris]|uniref:Uncharacterized protein n=1 Tax=Beta vulgaris subsp. vulgaris TaxID=3555 RepID=A0A0J8B7S1_BETVV|nr:hypothetical protein BVRB_004430 [Beta vulgaris subsp. vulgaris]